MLIVSMGLCRRNNYPLPMNEYFSHDYRARCDQKLVRLAMKYDLRGIGAYWCIVEMLYEEGGYLLRKEYERIAYELRVDTDFIRAVVEDFQLFAFKGERFYSPSALERLKKRTEKSQKARESVAARWARSRKRGDSADTNVLQPNKEGDTKVIGENDECTTIKEKKIKGKENHIYPPKSPLTDRENDRVCSDSISKEESCAKEERNIIPPRLDMVEAYCKKRGNSVDARVFMDHYTAKDWRIGGDRMFDWQAAIRTWEQKNKQLNTEKIKRYGSE